MAEPIVHDERFRELDGLRGIAALAVVLYHFTAYIGHEQAGEAVVFPDVWWGEYGVQLFFLISGFVILLSARRAKRPSDFIISRISRLYPVYWIAVTVGILLSVTLRLPGTGMGWVDRIANYTMIQRLLLFDNVDPVYWTLAIEMQFYILVLIALVAFRGRLTDRRVAVLVGIWITVTLCLAIAARPHTAGVDPQFVSTPWKVLVNLALVQWAPLFGGGMLAFIARGDRRYFPAAAIGLIAGPVTAWILRGPEQAILTAAVVLVFTVVVLRERTGLLRLAPIQFLGRISYSLYIGHLLTGSAIIIYATPFIGRDLSILVALVAVTGIAMTYHRLGEVILSRRMKRALVGLRDQWDHRRRAVGEPV